MQTAFATPGSTNPLVHLELRRRLTDSGMRLELSEQPLVSELALEVDADEALLIALGELLMIDQPLRVQAIAHCADLTLLWLDNRHWLLLPTPGDERAAAERLSARLLPDAVREDGEKLQLSDAWLSELPDSFQLWQSTAGALPVGSSASHPVIVPGGDEHYQLLVRRAGAELLQRWLQPH
ncbi:hypothetical protein GCM10011348_40100 [Marinobacterium nitratireducens]|uniref:Uncharacterized protein n=1 Tax=Marinobacterium nitratireducens TaxID=518897 RepID=A0A918DXJ4_9GAMM|nr:sarcosine oxidase subunit gamma family protein [Marinobacterium nitratireducens]GGO87280.1 hypothetical protein GCM10011348_40100 [Marinobacterium nitratireducens]